MRQPDSESPTAVGLRVETQCDRLDGLFHAQDVKDVFINGLSEIIQSHVRVLDGQFPKRTLADTISTAQMYWDETNILRLSLKLPRLQARSKFAFVFVARLTPQMTNLESPAGGPTDAHTRKRTYIGTFFRYSTTYSDDMTDVTSSGTSMGGGTRSDRVVVPARRRLNHDTLCVPAGGFHQHCCGCCAFVTGRTVETIENRLLSHPRHFSRGPCPLCTPL